MKFFSDLHRSIFDSGFYREAVERSRGRIAMFLFKLLVFTALIMGFSKAYYLVHSDRGVAPLVNAMFGDMEIFGGMLIVNREQPYQVPDGMAMELVNRIAGFSGAFGRAPDNFLVVDTRDPPAVYENAAAEPQILFKRSSVEFRKIHVEMPYSLFIKSGDFKFTVAAVQEYLDKNVASFVLNFFMISLFYGFFTMMLSVLFLSAASYMFAVNRSGGYWRFVRLACYAITPVMLGSAVVAVSGVSAEWAWHIFIIISTLLMFRGMSRTSPEKTSNEKQETV